MNDQPLTIDNLGDLDDGTVRHLINKALQEALDDCDARSMLDKDRKVTIALAFKPVIDEQGAMKGVAAATQVKTAVPPRAGHQDYLRANIHGDHVRAYLPDSHQDPLFGQRPDPEETS